MEHVLPAASLLLRFDAITAMFLGTALGIVVGALPGLGSIIALTICLPFTFAMDQVPAVALLLAAYCGSVYGGSISSILINTPGTLAAASTALDGYPMALRGEANKALGWATAASICGGLFSTVILVLTAPQLANFALRFGPIETFSVIILALTCIASISRGSMLKGLLAGAIGLFLAVIGADPITGDIRFDFGYFPLTAGIALVPMVVGLFALSEVLIRALELGTGRVEITRNTGMQFPRWSEWKPRLRLLLKSCTIGSLIGVLPGTGSAVAAFISYAEAKRTSPRRDKIGTGEPDGIVAAESANNAVTGGALVPTLALGIPGDAVTAVMVTTLLIQGITPGVRLMADNPQIVIAAFIALFLINLILLVQAYAASRGFAALLRTPEPLLLAMVAVFATVGAYGVRG
ncbi:MAG: tripartite tricarboxylate transporter permease, partial [Pseudomonadota bacterium]